MGVITRSVVAGSAQNGTVTSFDSLTGQFTFTPTADFIGTARFNYEVFCDSGAGPVSLGQSTVLVEVECPGVAMSACLSMPPAILINGDCIEVGDTEITVIITSVGTVKLYDKNKLLLSAVNVTNPGGYQMTMLPANVWDAYYVTFTATGKTESVHSNVITVCPKAPTTQACGNCGQSHNHCSCHGHRY